GKRMTRRRKATLLAASAGLVLVASGCGLGGPDPVEQLEEALEDVNEAQNQDDQADEVVVAGEAGGAADGRESLPVAPQQVGTTVHIGGLEYTIESLDVIDLDAEEGRDTRMQGAQVVLAGAVTNPGGDSANPNASFALEWQDPETGHSY